MPWKKIREAKGHAADFGHNFRVANQRGARSLIHEVLKSIPGLKPQKRGEFGFEYHRENKNGNFSI
jgi:hypothetical protein